MVITILLSQYLNIFSDEFNKFECKIFIIKGVQVILLIFL